MKKYNIFSIFTLLILLISACSKDWLDVNNDPNNPSSATPELVLPSATVSAGTVIGGYYNLLGGFWSQYWTQGAGSNQYKNIDTYQLLNSDFQDEWSELYAGTFKNFKYVKEASIKNKNWNYVFISTVLESYAYQVLVDLYDQIPFNDALEGESEKNIHPHFDPAITVYDSIASRLSKLSSLDLSVPLTDAQKAKDLVFGGDMDQWQAFANTLLLKIYLRQMYVRPQLAEDSIKALYSRGATFLSSDAKLDIFVDQPNKDNPLYESDRRGLNTTVNLRASTTLFKYLLSNNDPRRTYIYGLGPDNSTNPPIPAPQGSFSVTYFGLSSVLQKTSVVTLKPTDPVYFISEAESYFLQAEAAAMWGTDDDQALYEAGVTASFAKYGEDATSFLSGVYAYPSSGTFEDKQKAIIMQKWISMAGSEGIEAFFETNRTHYPSIATVTYKETGDNSAYDNWRGGELMYSLTGVTGGKFPKRLLFPSYERSRNPNTPAEVPIIQKVWWDKK